LIIELCHTGWRREEGIRLNLRQHQNQTPSLSRPFLEKLQPSKSR
jgi:hypothetical protein